MLTTKDKLLHFAAQAEQLRREIHAANTDAKDLPFAASHEVGTAAAYLDVVIGKLTRLASKL